MSSACGSRASISPQSSLQESFTQSPAQTSPAAIVAHTGQESPPYPTSGHRVSPSGLSLPEAQLPDPAPPEDLDSEFFNFVDMDPESWNSRAAIVDSSSYNHGHSLNHYGPRTNFQTSEQDPFAPGYGFLRDFTSMGTSPPGQLLSETNFTSAFPSGIENQTLQHCSEQSTTYVHPLEDVACPNAFQECDIDQLLLPYASDSIEISPMPGCCTDSGFYSYQGFFSGSATQRSTGARGTPSTQYTDYVLYPEPTQSHSASESERSSVPGNPFLHGDSTITTPLIPDIDISGHLQEALDTLQPTIVTSSNRGCYHRSQLSSHDIPNSLFESQNMDGDQGGGGDKKREGGDCPLPDARASEQQHASGANPDSIRNRLGVYWSGGFQRPALSVNCNSNRSLVPDNPSSTNHEEPILGICMHSIECSTCSATFNNAKGFYDHLGKCLRTVQKRGNDISQNPYRYAQHSYSQLIS
jgi:hypothetical protein